MERFKRNFDKIQQSNKNLSTIIVFNRVVLSGIYDPDEIEKYFDMFIDRKDYKGVPRESVLKSSLDIALKPKK